MKRCFGILNLFSICLGLKRKLIISTPYHRNYVTTFSSIPLVIPKADTHLSELDASIPSEDFSKKELIQLKGRLDKLEKSLSSLSSARSKGSVENFIDSLTASTIELNPQTVEICSIFSFFLIGACLGWSIYDRLWFMGGFGLSWWASGAVYRNSRSGMLIRRVGVQFAQLLKDIQEKWNQAIIFYRTGKIAVESAKIWEQYDQQLGVTRRVDLFKRRAMIRATEFNTFIERKKISSQILDVWKVIASAPIQARKFDSQYGFTSGLLKFSDHILRSGSNIVSDLIFGYGYDKVPSNESQRNKKALKTSFKPSIFSLSRIIGSNRLAKRRGRLVNPWSPFWESLTRKKAKKGFRISSL